MNPIMLSLYVVFVCFPRAAVSSIESFHVCRTLNPKIVEEAVTLNVSAMYAETFQSFGWSHRRLLI